MRIYWEYFLAGALAILVLLLMWFLPSIFHMQRPSDILILRSGVGMLGAMGIGGLIWWAHAKRAAQAVGPPPSRADADATQKVSGEVAGAGEDVDILIREAQRQLASSRLGRGASLGNLPAIFLVGDANSAKTSVVLGSGLDPELLAGHAMQEGSVTPTRAANFWLARKTVFVDTGSRLARDAGRWTRLVKKMAPGKLHSVFGRKQQAPRAAVVCFDCEMFTRPGAQDQVVATARLLRDRLGEISQLLGISFPVYVLFTRADKLSFFADFTRPLGSDEANQVFGKTLPAASGAGVYAEQETKRLTNAFNTLYYSVCDWRVPLLSRERDPARQPGVYEFPREFRKLRSLAVQFMVDLCRPSQLRTAPFLRGFYLCGTRSVTQTVASATATTVAASPFKQPQADSATRMMSMADARAMMEAEVARAAPTSPETRQVTQPVFLGHIFSHVILQDQTALSASGASTKVSFLRRALLIAATVIALVLATGFLVSFFGNRNLVAQITAASKAARFAPGAQPDYSQPPSLEQLQKLDALRQELAQLQQWEKDGAPWRLRWGLYTGNRIFPDVRRAYFARFHETLFGHTQEGMRVRLGALPTVVGPSDEYFPVYDQLKAYLITTAHPDKSTKEFLAPVLMRHWPAAKSADKPRADLALAQFEFYAEELKAGNPFSSDEDKVAVERARLYLSKFAATDRIYAEMRKAAAKDARSFQFSRNYPDAAGVVTNTYEVQPAFQKAQWAFMQDAIRNPGKYVGGEEWVIGPQTAAGTDFARISAEISQRFQRDFITAWREMLGATIIAGYAGIPDAAQKLNRHSGNQPPLMQLLCEVSKNTNVDNEAVKTAFLAVQQAQPPSCEAGVFVQPPNAVLVQALQPLQLCLDQVANAPPAERENLKTNCVPSVVQAKGAVKQIEVALKPDLEAKTDKTVLRLMTQTIAPLDGLLEKGVPVGPLCEAFNRLRSKYPFGAANPANAALPEELFAFFQPGAGILSKYYEENLKAMLIPQGAIFIPGPGAPPRLATFVNTFFNPAMAMQRTLYPGNAPTPAFRFTVKPAVIEGVPAITLVVNGQTQTTGIGVATAMNFQWPGSGDQEVKLTARPPAGGEVLIAGPFRGPWGLTQLVTRADRRTRIGNSYRAEWTPTTGNPPQPLSFSGNPPVRIVLDFDSGASPFFFWPGALSAMGCR